MNHIAALVGLTLSLTATSSWTVQAGAHFQRIGGFLINTLSSKPADSPTYARAIAAFGPATSCRLLYGSPTDSEVRWTHLGVRIRFATLGGFSKAHANACSAPREVYVDAAYVTGNRWTTTRHLRIGDSVARLRRLYPEASYRSARIDAWPAGYWLVAVRTRCAIGVCSTTYVTVPKLVAGIRRGHVASFVFPVRAEGE